MEKKNQYINDFLVYTTASELSNTSCRLPSLLWGCSDQLRVKLFKEMVLHMCSSLVKDTEFCVASLLGMFSIVYYYTINFMYFLKCDNFFHLKFGVWHYSSLVGLEPRV